MTENDHDSNEGPTVWGTTAFVPGGDVGLVARHTVALIERDNPSTRERLWELVARDAPLDDVLDELSSTGLKALPDFGIAQTDDDAVRIVARGRVTITVESATGDDRVIEASDVRTWIEEVVRDVVSITIALPAVDGGAGLAAAEGDGFAVLAGSVPASRLTRRFDEADRHAEIASSGSGWSSEPTSADMVEPVSDAPDLDVESPADPDESPGTDTDSPADAAPAAATSLFDDAPGPLADPATERQETVSGTEPDASPEWSAPPDEPLTGAVLVFSSGERVSVDRAVLIGRNPKVDEDFEGVPPHLMKFDGPGQGLSRTHAEVRLDEGGLVLEDLESTNGTEVELPGHPRRRLRSRDPIVIVPGTLIDFGDELHCTVEAGTRPPDV